MVDTLGTAAAVAPSTSTPAAGLALSVVGFQPCPAKQAQATVGGIYFVSTLVPGVLYAVAAFLLLFIYPLNQRRVAANVAELKARRGAGE